MHGVSDEELLKFWEPSRPMAPEMFAERALRAVLRGDAIIVVPAWWKALWYLERLSPALSMRAARLTLKRLREMESTAFPDPLRVSRVRRTDSYVRRRFGVILPPFMHKTFRPATFAASKVIHRMVSSAVALEV